MNRIINICMIFGLFFLFSCEEEGTPLTTEDLYRASGLPVKKFNVDLNGFEFGTDQVNALKIRQGVSISSTDGAVSYELRIKRLENGIFFGSSDSLRNVINYRDAGGLLFSSTKQGKPVKMQIEIVNFDPIKSVVSGNFRGTLYHLGSNTQLEINRGSFIEVPVEVPFFGEMNASLENKDFVAQNCIFSSTNSGGFVFETIAANANDDTLSISITIEEKISLKQYIFMQDNVTARYNANTFSMDVFKNLYTSESGILNVTRIDSINDRVEGTFSFRARNFLADEVFISNGSFKALIQ